MIDSITELTMVNFNEIIKVKFLKPSEPMEKFILKKGGLLITCRDHRLRPK